MKRSTKELIGVISAVIIAFAVAGWADSDNTIPAPEYTVVCGQGSEINSMCDIINVDGVKVDGVDMEIASENEFFSKPENVKLWVEQGKLDLK
jgi:hypothetical protein